MMLDVEQWPLQLQVSWAKSAVYKVKSRTIPSVLYLNYGANLISMFHLGAFKFQTCLFSKNKYRFDLLHMHCMGNYDEL
jgi:hypothetical protein